MPLDRLQTAQLKSFGANVRRERMRRGLTQEKLAEKVELHSRTLQKIERGETNILLTTMMRIQRTLRCRWEDLLGKA